MDFNWPKRCKGFLLTVRQVLNMPCQQQSRKLRPKRQLAILLITILSYYFSLSNLIYRPSGCFYDMGVMYLYTIHRLFQASPHKSDIPPAPLQNALFYVNVRQMCVKTTAETIIIKYLYKRKNHQSLAITQVGGFFIGAAEQT